MTDLAVTTGVPFITPAVAITSQMQVQILAKIKFIKFNKVSIHSEPNGNTLWNMVMILSSSKKATLDSQKNVTIVEFNMAPELYSDIICLCPVL